ncbi:MAG: hypothetical protein NTU44_17410 [Bacteroidetes bacterium]|nr:hypothetical protein [Bacteroidota bacterium]
MDIEDAGVNIAGDNINIAGGRMNIADVLKKSARNAYMGRRMYGHMF